MMASTLASDDPLERRYIGLVRLARAIAEASDWSRLCASISGGLADPLNDAGGAPGVRLWANLSEGFEELARHPVEHSYAPAHPRDLQHAALIGDPIDVPDGCLLVGLHACGVSLGVLEVDAPDIDAELVAHAAPVIACQMSVLAAQGVGDVLIAPFSVESGSDAAPVMAQFATEAKRLLEHDRLSAYLLTHDGRAFERFAVATSPIIPGEGVIIPFEDVGLRHIVLTNRALVSEDLATDPRIVGREDRVIAGGGFHGLLSVPLRRDGRPFGVLNFVSRAPAFYREDDIPVAQQIADQISAFVENVYVQRRMQMMTRHEAAEQERARVVRDVYHAIGQTVPEIDAVAARLAKRLGPHDAEGAAHAERVRTLAQLELTEIRRAIAGLVPPALDTQSLEDAIEQLVAQLSDDASRTTLTVIGSTAGIAPAARRAAFRIFQEAFTNARLHAHATSIRVELKAGRDIELIVSDDGIGFRSEGDVTSAGLGIRFMHERAQALGGVLTVDTAAGAGTTVRLELLGAGDVSEQGHTPDDAAAPGTATLRVFVAERDHLVRSGLIRVLERSGDMRVVGEGSSAEEVKARLRQMRPDILLLDARIGPRVPELLPDIHAHAPSVAVLVLTDREPANEADLRAAGAGAVIDKHVDAAELLAVVRAVAGGETVAPSSPVASNADPANVLTDRELSILALVAAGETNNEVGKTLFLATKTVERHVATIIQKLGARNRAHAAAIAISRRLVEPTER